MSGSEDDQITITLDVTAEQRDATEAFLPIMNGRYVGDILFFRNTQ